MQRLHKAITYFIRIQADDTDVEMVKHHYYLLEYARVMEFNYGAGTITTCNLHNAVCRLLDQCRARGHCGWEGDLWIERSVQMLTRSLSQAVTTPELTMAHRLLYDDASLRIARGVPEAIDLAEELPVFVRDR